MTRDLTSAKALILARVEACLSTPDAIGLQYLWALGLDGSVEEANRLSDEIRSHVERALEDFRP